MSFSSSNEKEGNLTNGTEPLNNDADKRTSIPDGGVVAWMQCVASFCLLLNSFGIVNSYGAFQTYYKNGILADRSNSEIAWIGSVQSFLNIFLGVVGGPIYDRGHLRLLLLVGTIAVVVGLVTTGLCRTYWEFMLAQGVLTGIGAGLLFLPSIAILSQHFHKRLNLATGIGSVGVAVGSICFPILIDQLTPRIGFRHSVWIIALISLVTQLISFATIRMRFKPESIREIYDFAAFKEAPFNLWSAYLFISLLTLYTPSVYIQQYALTVMDANLAYYTLPVLYAGSLFGRVIPLYFADKLGPLNVEVPFTMCGGILALCWIAIHNTGGVMAFSAIYGFFAGAITTLTAPIDVALSPRLELVGVRMGMLLVPWSIGLLIGTPISGAILGSSGGWTALKIYVGVILLVASLLCAATRISKYGMAKVRC